MEGEEPVNFQITWRANSSDAEVGDGEIAGARAVTELRNEIAALRAEIRPLEID